MLLKPNQAHRVIKDSRPSPTILQPIAIRDTSTTVRTSSASDAGSILPRIDNNVGHVSDKEQLEYMKKRVKDLEKENFKLSHHVSQAEQSIKNYRGFLANRPSSSSMPSTTRDYAVQTDVDAQTQLQQISQLTERANKAEAKLSTITALNADLIHKNNEFMKENVKLREQLDRRDSNQQSETKQLLEKIELQQKQIREYETSLATHSTNSLNINSFKVKLLKNEISVKDLQQCVRVTRAAVTDELKLLQESLKFDYEQIITQIVSKFMAESKQFEDRINQLMADRYKTDILMNKLNQELSIAKREMDQLVILHEKEKQLLIKSNQQQTILSSSGAHISPVHSNKLHPLMSSLHSSLSPDLKKDKTQHHNHHQSSNSNLITPSKHTNSSSHLLQGMEEDRLLLTEYRNKLQQASVEVINLQLVHAAEVKAIQHVSHVKELIRVAKERETTLQIEKMTIEIKHLKEIQNILIFSIGTAEQSLNELQPHVVVKLVEGRKKRLKLLENTLHGRMKDIDQRSAETCVANTAHLEGFQKKAIDNSKTAETMTKAAVAKLQDLLLI